MEALAQSAFEAVGEIGHVWAFNPLNVSATLSPSLHNTFYFSMSTEIWPPSNGAGTLCVEPQLVTP